MKNETVKKFSRGQAILFLLLGIIVIVAIVAAVLLNQPSFANLFKNSPEKTQEEQIPGKMPEPVYEVTVGNVVFRLLTTGTRDRGNILRKSESNDPERTRADLKTTDKFIEVRISAQNIGTDNIAKGDWKVDELVDSEGRKFYPIDAAKNWIKPESDCGELLKPNFTPTPCIKIYEVSKNSVGLKARVIVVSYDKAHKKNPQTFYVDLGLYNEKYCWNDSDCGCGINKYTGDCFLGHKTYLATSTASTTTQEIVTSTASSTENADPCAVFCHGDMGEFIIKCLSSQCKQVLSSM